MEIQSYMRLRLILHSSATSSGVYNVSESIFVFIALLTIIAILRAICEEASGHLVQRLVHPNQIRRIYVAQQNNLNSTQNPR